MGDDQVLARSGRIKLALPAGMTDVGYSADAFEAGEIVYEWNGPTWGVISGTGVAVTREPNTYPFLEVPREAVSWAIHD